MSKDHDKIRGDGNPVIHRAGWVIADSKNIIRNGYVTVDSGRVVEVGQGKPAGIDENSIDHGAGAIMPALVNSHTHLELSALAGRIPLGLGFERWVKELLVIRDSMDREELIKAAVAGMESMTGTGCILVGEISTMGITREAFVNSDLFGVWFREVLGQGWMGEIECGKMPEGKRFSAAAHAPHTSLPDLIAKARNIAGHDDLPFSIHLCESKEEMEFIATGKGGWADFLLERGIHFPHYFFNGDSPVSYLEKLGVLDEKTIAVHLLFCHKKDFEILLNHGVRACLCPRSNKNLHQRLPDIMAMVDLGLKPCLGTDSLACVPTLSMFDEMAFVSSWFPDLKPGEILDMATVNGAGALGFAGELGVIHPGSRADFIYVEVDGSSPEGLLSNVVNGDIKTPCKRIR